MLEKISYLIKNKHVGSVLLMCSFDCWGPQIEYIRYGSNLKLWEENFKILLKEYPAIDAIVHSTLTALTFDTLPALCNKIKEWNYIRPTLHTISTVDSRPFLHPGIMPAGFYSDKIKEMVVTYQDIIKLMQNIHYERSEDNEMRIPAIKHWHKIIAQLKGYEKTFDQHVFDKNLIKELRDYLTENDYRRRSNWKDLWPWLDTIDE